MRDSPERQLSVLTATQLVVASMVGTGVFTTTGYFLADVPSAPAALLVWALGGVLALCGALSYAELAAALPRNGGEVALLGRIYHPVLGFVAGVVGVVVGFAAPIAAAGIAFGEYATRAFPALTPGAAPLLGVAGIVASSGAHLMGVQRAARTQDVFTALKIVSIAALGVIGCALGDPSRLFVAEVSLSAAVTDIDFAVGLVYIGFAYTGWNAAAYVAGELRDPGRNIPRALALGTAGVALLYLLLNAAFLADAPIAALAGQTEIAYVAAEFAAGELAARILSGVIALGLLSTIGAMTMTGARMAEALTDEYPRLRGLRRRTPESPPRRAIVLLASLAVVMAFTATFDALLLYVGVTLTLAALLTTLGVIVLRVREPDLPRPYRTFAYPLTPLLFIVLATWMIVASIVAHPAAAAAAATTILLSLALWLPLRPPQNVVS